MASISGMIGNTYFADSPVVITVTGPWPWPEDSPFKVVRLNVIYGGNVVGEFPAETGGQPSVDFDISTALYAIWTEEDFSSEVSKANRALGTATEANTRASRSYSLKVYSEFISSDGVFTRTESATVNGGSCVVGGMTEWERSLIASNGNKSVTHWNGTNKRFGSASTKPTSSPEHVGKDSITSWVGLAAANTTSHYYTANATTATDQDGDHAPIVLRDSQEYVDFLFANRRGAVETCSGLTKEAMEIGVETKQYGRVERPTFKPSRSVMALGSDGRRSWNMSSGYVTREWAEWWATEFLGGKRKRWWMRWQGPGMASATFVPVIVEPAKKSTSIFDRAKQNMPHVDFTVTLALEG